MGAFKSWEALRAQATKSQVLEVELQDLKDLQGVKRLGANVLRDIVERLDDERLTYWPAQVLDHNTEPRQDHIVWLTPTDDQNVIYKVVKAVQDPTLDGVNTLLGLLADDNGWPMVEELKTRLGNVRAALEDAMDSLGDPPE